MADCASDFAALNELGATVSFDSQTVEMQESLVVPVLLKYNAHLRRRWHVHMLDVAVLDGVLAGRIVDAEVLAYFAMADIVVVPSVLFMDRTISAHTR